MIKLLKKDGFEDKYEELIAANILKESQANKRALCVESLKKSLIEDGNNIRWDFYYNACKNLIINRTENFFYIESLFVCVFENMDENSFKNVMKEIKDDYSNLWVYNKIDDYYSKSNRIKQLRELIREICEYIETEYEKINLLEDMYWNIENIFVLCKFLGEEWAQKIFLKWLNPNTIINYLKIGIRYSYDGSTFSYYYVAVNSDENDIIKNILKDIDESELDDNSYNIIDIYKNASKDHPKKFANNTEVIL